MSSQRFSITGKRLDETILTSMNAAIIAVSLFASIAVMLVGHYNPTFVQEKNTPSGCKPRPSYVWLAMTVLVVAAIMVGVVMAFGPTISKKILKYMS